MTSAALGGPGPIRDMFDALVPGYDRFNALSSLGLDSRWRRKAVRLLERGTTVLDVGTGTGDMAKLLLDRGCVVTGVDVSEKMIKAAQEKLIGRANVSLRVSGAHELPFPSQNFSGVTSAFVLRNLHRGEVMVQSFREFYRVLKPGGRMVHLELTRPNSSFVRWGHKIYLRTVLPLIGRTVFGRRWPNQYLSTSIETFPDPLELCRLIQESGFHRAWHTPLSGGVAGLFIGERN